MALCDSCEKLDLDERESLLSTYDEMVEKASAGCGGCQFFCDILHSSSRHERSSLEGQTVFLSSLRLDCRKPGKLSRSIYSCDDLLLDVCKPEQSNVSEEDDDPKLDYKREVPNNPMADSCINLMKSWVQNCLAHSSCRKRADVPLPPVIIDVPGDSGVDPELINTNGQMGQYAVLSYCDADRKSSTSTITLEIRSNPLNKNDLPRAFRDAIEITRLLGLRYLWIDAFCSKNANPAGVGQDFRKSNDIYTQCAVLLSADRGGDCNTGMLGDRKVAYSPLLGKKKNRHLRQTLLRWKWDIDYSPLHHQAWAAEARYLSPRILHFTQRQLIWECAGGHFWEASGIGDDEFGSGQRRMQFRKESAQPVVERLLRKEIGGDESTSRNVTREILEAWYQGVDDFSSLQLADPVDKLPAIAGMAAVFDNANLGTYLAGIWAKHLTFGLSWSRSYSLLKKPAQYRAPSWSWASIDGGITSLINSWPPTRMQEQFDDPAWIDKFGPRILECHMNLSDPSNPYVGFEYGSLLKVEATCIGFHQLMSHVEFKPGFNQRFFPIVVLDTSDTFDCPCCRPGGIDRDDPNATLPPVSTDETKRMESYLCMIVQGEDWITPKSDCFFLLLQPVGSPTARKYERVGCVDLTYDRSFEDQTEFMEKGPALRKDFEGFEWEWRELELI